MTVIEERYRSVLRLLPGSYREIWEEDMVATFLETMTREDPDEAQYLADCGRPGLPEVASIVSLAARLRLGGVDAPPRAHAWGEAARRVALVGLLVNAVVGSVGIAISLWEAGRVPLLPGPSSELVTGPTATSWNVVLIATGVFWMGAYVALVLGHRRPAQVLAGFAVAPFLATAIWLPAGMAIGRAATIPQLMTVWCVVLLDTVVVASLAAFHRDAPPVKTRPWLIAGGLGMAMAPVVATLLVVQSSVGGMLLDWPAICCFAVVTAAVILTIRGVTTPWTIALSVLALGALTLRHVSAVDYSWHGNVGWSSAAVAMAIVEAAVVLVACLWLVGVSLRALRNLPRPGGAELGARS